MARSQNIHKKKVDPHKAANLGLRFTKVSKAEASETRNIVVESKNVAEGEVYMLETARWFPCC